MTRVTRDYDKGHDHMIEIRWQSLPPKKVWQTSLGPLKRNDQDQLFLCSRSFTPDSLFSTLRYEYTTTI